MQVYRLSMKLIIMPFIDGIKNGLSDYRLEQFKTQKTHTNNRKLLIFCTLLTKTFQDTLLYMPNSVFSQNLFSIISDADVYY